MLDKLAAVEARYNELVDLMSSPTIADQPELLAKYGQEQASLEPMVETYHHYRQVVTQLNEAHQMMTEDLDDDMKTMVRDEIDALKRKKESLEYELRVMLLPKDPNDDKNVIVEIRAGAGGNEAGLFAADLFRIYSRYGERQHWKTSILSRNESGIGGFKEIIFRVTGQGAYSKLKYESGVHRVQRIPVTESLIIW